MTEMRPFYSTVWIVSPLDCECAVLRTKDRYEAVELAKANNYRLDAVACKSPDQEARELDGAVGCGCGA